METAKSPRSSQTRGPAGEGRKAGVGLAAGAKRAIENSQESIVLMYKKLLRNAKTW